MIGCRLGRELVLQQRAEKMNQKVAVGESAFKDLRVKRANPAGQDQGMATAADE